MTTHYDGSPRLPFKTCAADGWSVGYLTGGDQDGVTLCVSRYFQNRPNEWGGRGVSVPHPILHHTVWPTQAEAEIEAFAMGVIVPFRLNGVFRTDRRGTEGIQAANDRGEY